MHASPTATPFVRALSPIFAWLLPVAFCGAAGAGEKYVTAPLKEPAPEEVSAEVRGLLSPEGFRVLEPGGKPFVDVWLRRTVPTREARRRLGIDYGQVADGTLLGVVRYHGREKDFRGNRFPAGIYTIRYGIQPEDGDHQGVSLTRDFVLLSPAKVDAKPDPIPTKELVELSVKVTGRSHPTILYLIKPFQKPGKFPRMIEDEEYEYWILDCSIPHEEKKGGGKDGGGGKGGKASVRLGIVLVGEADEF